MAVTTQSLKYFLVFALGLTCAAFAAESPEIITLRTKAVHGNAIAQYNLGRIFADTKSANLDRAEAFVWFQIAADNGTTGRELARLIEVMTPQELAEGKARLQERRAQLSSLRDPATIKAEPAASAASDDTVAKLTAERDQLVASLNAATAELAVLRVNAAKAAKTEATSDKPIDDLTRLNNELNETRATARQFAAKNAQLEDVAEERGRDLQAAKVELAKLKAEAPATQTSPAQDSQLTALTAERDLLTKQLSDAQEQVRKLAERPERLSRAERDADLLRTQNAKLASALRDAEAQLKANSGKENGTATRDEKLAQAQKEINELNKRNLDLADRAQRAYSAEQELRSARDQVATEQKKVEELTASAAQLSQDNEKLRSAAASKSSAADLQVLRDQLAIEQKKVEELTANAEQLAQANEKLRNATESKATNEALQALRDQVIALQKENAQLAQRATVAETKLAATPPPAPAAVEVQAAPESENYKKQLDETNDKLATALRSYSLLQQELDQAKATSSQSNAELGAKLGTAESEITALRNQLASTTSESQERANALAALQREMEQQRHTMITQGQETLSLRDQLRQTLSQVAVLVDENSQLKTRVAVLAPPPASSMANPTRPGTAAAQAAITLPSTLAKPAATARVNETRQHIITDGDSLSKISRKYYGTPDRWNEIYQANRNILSDPGRLPKGAALKIP